MSVSSRQSLHVSFEIREKLVEGGESVWFLVIAVVAMIPFACLVVVADHTAPIATAVQAILEPVRTVVGRLRRLGLLSIGLRSGDNGRS